MVGEPSVNLVGILSFFKDMGVDEAFFDLSAVGEACENNLKKEDVSCEISSSLPPFRPLMPPQILKFLSSHKSQVFSGCPSVADSNLGNNLGAEKTDNKPSEARFQKQTPLSGGVFHAAAHPEGHNAHQGLPFGQENATHGLQPPADKARGGDKNLDESPSERLTREQPCGLDGSKTGGHVLQTSFDKNASFAKDRRALPLKAGGVEKTVLKNASLPFEASEKPSQPLFEPPQPLSNMHDALEKITTLTELQHLMETFEGCDLKKTARTMVFSDGQPKSKVMLIGEAPGAEEDLLGKPFVGRSGQLLDRMLAAVGLDRTNVYISNVVPWRPPGNRLPTPQEIALCLPFLEKHIQLISPRVLLLLGSTAAKTLLGSKEGITRLRGRFLRYANPFLQNSIDVLATFHPAYLLRSPGQKKLVWEDLQKLQAKIKAFEEEAV